MIPRSLRVAALLLAFVPTAGAASSAPSRFGGKSLAQWIEVVSSASGPQGFCHLGGGEMPGELTDALSAMESFSEDLAPAVPAFSAWLQSENPTCIQSARVLLPLAGPSALAPLEDALSSSRPSVRGAALEALAWLGPDARPAAPMLVQWIHRGDLAPGELDRVGAILAGLDSIKAVEPLLDDPDPHTRARAARVLGAHSDGRALDALFTRADREPDLLVVQGLAAGLGRQLGDSSPKVTSRALDALSRGSESPSAQVRRLVALALGSAANEPGSEKLLLRLADDSEPSVRLEAVRGLWNVRIRGAEWQLNMDRAAHDTVWSVRSAARGEIFFP